MKFSKSVLLLSVVISMAAHSQIVKQADSVKVVKTEVSSPKKWFDKISLRGYAQLRYNRLMETNSKLKCEQCDRSWGEN